MSGMASTEPIAAQVLVLEDEVQVAESLEIEINRLGNAQCQRAQFMKEFSRLVNTCAFDVASIDWELHGYMKGSEALQYLARKQPEPGRIVFTKHKGQMEEALERGADECFLKPPGLGLDDYTKAIKRGIRVGFGRRIVGQLRQLGETGLPDLPPGVALDVQVETAIFQHARRTAILQKVERRDGASLVELLRRRGWWRTFDLGKYVRFPPNAKLKQLMVFVELDAADVARILGIGRTETRKLLSSQVVDNTLGISSVELEHAHALLAVLGYVLRLSGYEPDLMSYFWLGKNLYQRGDPPPWNMMGLAAFLMALGPAGLRQSIEWIRSQ